MVLTGNYFLGDHPPFLLPVSTVVLTGKTNFWGPPTFFCFLLPISTVVLSGESLFGDHPPYLLPVSTMVQKDLWHTWSFVPEDIVGLIMWRHESWMEADATNTHMQAQTNGCSVIIHFHTGIKLHKHSRLCVDAVWICDVTTTWIHKSTTWWFR